MALHSDVVGRIATANEIPFVTRKPDIAELNHA